MDITRLQITPDKPFPGNTIEVRLYRSVFAGEGTDLSAEFSRIFTENGWSDPWVNGIYGFHHFHAEAHEALGCSSGWVVVQLGGPNGPEIKLEAGDAVLLPAGVSHKNIDSSPNYQIMGSYPHNQEPDLRRGDPDEWEEVLHRISQTELWDQDPITGVDETPA